MQNKNVSEKLLTAGIVISMFLWGLSWPSGKVLTSYLSLVNFALFRYILVIITMIPILIFLKIPLTGNRKGVPLVISSGILLAVYSYLFYVGLKFGFAGAGGVLVTTLNPIVAYSIAILLNRKLPSGKEQAGLLIGLVAGCILLKVWDHTTSLINSGNLFFVGATITWAVMSKLTSKASNFGSSLTFSLWQYVITFFVILPFINIHEFVGVFSIPDKIFWLNLIFNSIIVTALATTLYFYATTVLGPEKASSFIFLVPFAAEISSWLLLNESILVHTVVGGLLGIAAVYIINLNKRKVVL